MYIPDDSLRDNTTLTAVDGIRVGHWQDDDAETGCTVILCPDAGCLASGEIRGSAPGSRETALLEPEKSVERVFAVTLAGGSAFGLAAAQGVTDYLGERNIGYDTPYARVPIVPAAVIYDLSVGDPKIRPTAASGYTAASRASAAPVALGRVGVGTSSSCGKYLGPEFAERSGLGSAALRVQGATVAALSVANPFGDIVDPDDGTVVAGARLADGRRPGRDTMHDFFAGDVPDGGGTNTTLVVVATDARLSKAQAKHLAQSAHVGIARVTRPSHTVFDGDSSFVLSTLRGPEVALFQLSVAVQEVVAQAILAGARALPSR
ncbi:MAG: P1 family peptidase [Trueperaceae bacterium]|nr:P1 family peptidase [Trueperaceae bacterium]